MEITSHVGMEGRPYNSLGARIGRIVRSTALYGLITLGCAVGGTIAGGKYGERTAPPRDKSGYLLGNPEHGKHVRACAITGLEAGLLTGLGASVAVGALRNKSQRPSL